MYFIGILLFILVVGSYFYFNYEHKNKSQYTLSLILTLLFSLTGFIGLIIFCISVIILDRKNPFNGVIKLIKLINKDK
jgi:CDP-diglyceride synthetase